jgi:hypothetical protein
MLSEGAITYKSLRLFKAPPSRPRNPIVCIPFSFAVFAALIRFGELPLPLK